MKNLKLLFSLVLAAGCVTMIGCSKSNNNSSTPPASSDSVLYTNWTPLNMSGFTDGVGDTFFAQTIIAKSITAAVINHGLVLGYVMNIDQGNDTLIENVSDIMTMVVYRDSIYLQSNPFQINSSANDYSGVPFRYVIVPGKIFTTRVAGTVKTYTAAQLNTMSYAEVRNLFNLPDLFNIPKGYIVPSKSFSKIKP